MPTRKKPPTLGEAVRQRRELLGLSQERAASLAGITKQAWLDIEHDRRDSRGQTLNKIETALELPAGALRGDLADLPAIELQTTQHGTARIAASDNGERLARLEATIERLQEANERLSSQVADLLAVVEALRSVEQQSDRPGRRGTR